MPDVERKFRIFGWTDEVTTCDCCGKDKLSGTFAVELTSDGSIVHYGSVCVTRNTAIKNPKTAANKYHEERMKLAQIKFKQSPEYRAKEAKFAIRNGMKLLPGLEALRFVKDECDAADAVIRDLKTEYRLDYFWE